MLKNKIMIMKKFVDFSNILFYILYLFYFYNKKNKSFCYMITF